MIEKSRYFLGKCSKVDKNLRKCKNCDVKWEERDKVNIKLQNFVIIHYRYLQYVERNKR